jgi:hypothetical protein
MVGLIRRCNVGRILLRRPGCLFIIHLLIVFGSERSRRHKRIPNDLISVSESVTSLGEIDDSIHWFTKEVGIPEIPIPRDEKDLIYRSGFQNLFEEREEELVGEGSLVRDHIFVSFCRREGGKKITTDGDDAWRRRDRESQEFLIEVSLPVEV